MVMVWVMVWVMVMVMRGCGGGQASEEDVNDEDEDEFKIGGDHLQWQDWQGGQAHLQTAVSKRLDGSTALSY